MNYTIEEIESMAQSIDVPSMARVIFSQQPINSQQYRMLLSDLAETEGLEYLFEILITFCLEGLEILAGGDITRFPMDQFTEQTVVSLNPWFHQLGFRVYCSEYASNLARTDFNQNYCTVYIRSTAESLFIARKIPHNYTFTCNGNYGSLESTIPSVTDTSGSTVSTKLSDIWANFVYKTKLFVISFDFFIN